MTGMRTVSIHSIIAKSALLTSRQVITAMQPWREESVLPDLVLQQMTGAAEDFGQPRDNQLSPTFRREHLTKLHNLHGLLEQVRASLDSDDQDRKLMDTLIGYVQRLRSFNVAQSAGEQFNQLYALRKWLFWVPIDMLQTRKNDPSALLILAYYFTTMLELEPMFPDVSAAFGADLALPPLEEIIRMIDSLLSPRTSLPYWQTILALLKYPRKTATSFQSKRTWLSHETKEAYTISTPSYGTERLNMDLVQQVNDYQFIDGRDAFRDSPLSQFGNVFPPEVGSSFSGPVVSSAGEQPDYGIVSGAHRPPVVGRHSHISRPSISYGSPADRLVPVSPESRRKENYSYGLAGTSYPYTSGCVDYIPVMLCNELTV